MVVLLIFSFLVFPFFVYGVGTASGVVTSSAISQAEEVVASAYEAVLEAERAGANVSGLLVRLNEAGELLAMARVAFRLGDFDEAVFSANNCSETGESVKNDADELRVEAYNLRTRNFWLTMTGSIIGVVTVVFGSFWGWRFFKRRYVQRILKMKPEVSADEF